MDSVLDLARGADGDPRQFDMTALSLRLSNSANARQQAPQRHGQQHLAGSGKQADHRRDQRRAHAGRGSGSPCAISTSAT